MLKFKKPKKNFCGLYKAYDFKMIFQKLTILPSPKQQIFSGFILQGHQLLFFSMMTLTSCNLHQFGIHCLLTYQATKPYPFLYSEFSPIPVIMPLLKPKVRQIDVIITFLENLQKFSVVKKCPQYPSNLHQTSCVCSCGYSSLQKYKKTFVVYKRTYCFILFYQKKAINNCRTLKLTIHFTTIFRSQIIIEYRTIWYRRLRNFLF